MVKSVLGGVNIQIYQPCPGVNILLIPYSNEKVNVRYANDQKPFQLPKISTRPPYYTNPQCQLNYPIL